MPRCGLNRRNCEGVAFSHDVSIVVKIYEQIYSSDSSAFYQIQFVGIVRSAKPDGQYSKIFEINESFGTMFVWKTEERIHFSGLQS